MSIAQTADYLTVPDHSVSGEDPLPVAEAQTGLMMDRPDPVDTEHVDDSSYILQERDTGSSRDGSATIRWSFWSNRDHNR